jgi:hypothetical protein
MKKYKNKYLFFTLLKIYIIFSINYNDDEDDHDNDKYSNKN